MTKKTRMAQSQEAHMTPQEEGEVAYWNGKNREDNPYKERPKREGIKHDNWNTGYAAAWNKDVDR